MATHHKRPESTHSTLETQALDSLFAQIGAEPEPRQEPAPRPAPKTPVRDAAVSRRPHSRSRHSGSSQPAPRRPTTDWPYRAGQVVCLAVGLLGAYLLWWGTSTSQRNTSAVDAPAQDRAATPWTTKRLVTKEIQHVALGERIRGENPLREQVEGIEPDPATWRMLSLSMTKANGLGLWIDLLRPLEWIEAVGAKPGRMIQLEMPEFGAVDEAEVIYLGPCPEIKSGTGTVVTGKFKHQVDPGTQVVHLRLEGQSEPTGVTVNHPYWSVDRQDFVEVGQLRAGEHVDTEFGMRRVVSITSVVHTGFVYNLETTEHVFRVGSLGTLVHNTCAIQPFDVGRGHHIFAKKAFEGVSGYNPAKAFAIPNSEIARLGLKHLDSGGMTQTQRKLFTQLAASGNPNTLAAHARIARKSLEAGGLSKKESARIVKEALDQLKKWGVTAPSGIPWN